jgi:hypothetical protein
MRIPARYFVLLLPLVFAGPAQAEKITIDEDTNLSVGVLIQPQFTVTEEASPSGDIGTDFFIRRARFLFTGQYNENISFIFVTDQANWGKNGNFATPEFIVQDAAAVDKVGDPLTISAGFILLPFTRHGVQSAGALNLIDYRLANIKFPPTGAAFRDMGVEARGLLAADRFFYRVGIFSGIAGTAVDDVEINPSDAPRLTGMLRFNILGKENVYAPPSIGFVTDPVVSVGVGADWQNEAFGDDSDARYLGLAGDVFIDYPLPGDQEFAAQATVIRYDSYLAGVAPDTQPDQGTSFFVEAGYRIQKIEPVAAVEYFKGDLEGTEILNLRFGLNYFIAKNNFNVKAEVLVPNNEEVDGVPAAPENIVGTLQTQVVF